MNKHGISGEDHISFHSDTIMLPAMSEYLSMVTKGCFTSPGKRHHRGTKPIHLFIFTGICHPDFWILWATINLECWWHLDCTDFNIDKETSVDVPVAAVLSNQKWRDFFTYKEEQRRELQPFLGGKRFHVTTSRLLQEFCLILSCIVTHGKCCASHQ